MKYLLYLLLLLVSASCVSTKYNSQENQGNFDKIQAGTKYVMFDLNNKKSTIKVTSVEKDSIIGTHKKQVISIAKNDITKIKKNKTGATVILIGGTAGILTVTYVLVEALKGIGEGFGHTIGGH